MRAMTLMLTCFMLLTRVSWADPASYLVICDTDDACGAAPHGSALDRIWANADFNYGTGFHLVADDNRALWGPSPPALTLKQQAVALAYGGLTITSTGTPAINGRYATDPASLTTITEIATGISAGQGFPGGGSTFEYVLANGITVVTFASTDTFLAVAVAIRDFVYTGTKGGRGSVSFPPDNVTIP